MPSRFLSGATGSVKGLYGPEAQWLKQVHDQEAMLARTCSEALLLGVPELVVDCAASIHGAMPKCAPGIIPV
jgi:hypothetical protein